MELKGTITEGESKHLTCCTHILDLQIGGVSLFDSLETLFNQDSEEFWNAPYDDPKQSPTFGVKFVVLDEAPLDEKSFNDLSAEMQYNMIYADHVSGCYSEYTCGYGSFDYVLGAPDGSGHSVFTELRDHVGKYVHFTI